MATEEREASENAASEQPDPRVRHQQGRENPPGDDASAGEGASQQQQ